MQPGTRYSLEVNPKIPKRLARLEELAGNLWYSWDRPTRAIFARLNPALWDAVGHNPKAMLKRIDEQRLIDAASDPAFLDSLTRVLAAFDAYHAEPPFRSSAGGFKGDELVAYFCAEFGVHESLPLYSGGLGILAGDHLKSASDCGLPLVAVGLRYRQGYFHQRLDVSGWQTESYVDTDFGKLPVGLVLKEATTSLTVTVSIRGRIVTAQIWVTAIGRVPLILLDTDRDDNDPVDRW